MISFTGLQKYFSSDGRKTRLALSTVLKEPLELTSLALSVVLEQRPGKVCITYWSVLLSHQSWCLVVSCYIIKPWDILRRDTRGAEEGVWFPGSETALNKRFLRVPHPGSSQNQRWRFEWPPYHSSALTEYSSSCILVRSGDGGSIRTRVWSDSHLRPRSLHSNRSMYKYSSDSVRLRAVVRYNKYRKHRRGEPLFFH